MQENKSGSDSSVRRAIGLSIVLFSTLAVMTEASQRRLSYGCSDIHRFLERSEGAFPRSHDPQALLEYPVRKALKELEGRCNAKGLLQADVREAIERHVSQSLAPGQSRFTLAIVSFAWCSACTQVFPDYRRLAKRRREEVRFVFLDGDAYDGSSGPAPESPFSDLISGACGVRIVPFYPGYCVVDDRGRALRVGAAPPPTQSFYGGDGLGLAMKQISKAQKGEAVQRNEYGRMTQDERQDEP